MPVNDYTIQELREQGYAVCVFNPEELKGAAPKWIEDAMAAMGNTMIDSHTAGEDMEEDDFDFEETPDATY